MDNEPIIVMNLTRLTNGQSMTIRVAIESFAASLQKEGCLGSDKNGEFIRKSYLKTIDELRKIMYEMDQ